MKVQTIKRLVFDLDEICEKLGIPPDKIKWAYYDSQFRRMEFEMRGDDEDGERE